MKDLKITNSEQKSLTSSFMKYNQYYFSKTRQVVEKKKIT